VIRRNTTEAASESVIGSDMLANGFVASGLAGIDGAWASVRKATPASGCKTQPEKRGGLKAHEAAEQRTGP